MDRYDVKRELARCYAPRNRTWELVDVPPQQFIGVAGHGDPNTSASYAAAVGALYAVAWTLKFDSKGRGQDLVVGPLEGLWWAEDPHAFVARAKHVWHWRVLISQPEWVTAEHVAQARDVVRRRKNLPAVDGISLHDLDEGTSAQVLHVGPYDDEAPLLAALHGSWLAEHGLRETGPHHEIYLGDHRRVAPDRMRTVLRQPVEPVA